MSKVRIYNLTKELKPEIKKILEDARRLGVDVSAPSNRLEDNIAAKIREMYYPKKEQAPAILEASEEVGEGAMIEKSAEEAKEGKARLAEAEEETNEAAEENETGETPAK